MTKEQIREILETINSLRGGLDDLEFQLQLIRKANIANKVLRKRSRAKVIPISHSRGSSLPR